MATIKEWLNEYRAARWEIVRRERRIEELAAMAESHGASAYMQRNGGAPSPQWDDGAEVAAHSDPTGRYASAIADVRAKVRELEAGLEPCEEAFRELCGKLPEKVMSDLIVARYHDCKDWDNSEHRNTVAAEISYSLKHTHTIHGKAIACLSEICGALVWRSEKK
jgi:hypothetical protein